jgi:hypothetical protein
VTTPPTTSTHPTAAADLLAADATAELADLLKQTAKPATILAKFAAGAALDVDRLALTGTDDELDAWRTTRVPDARWRELLARWRATWHEATTGRDARIPPHLRPRGLDLYLWAAPHLCDHEQVRLGATHVQVAGAPIITLVHVDLVRVAQQDTPVRLLGPTAALDLLGPDGIVQEGHPLRTGVRYSGADNAYRPDRPTWIPPKPEPSAPSIYVESGRDVAAWLNNARDTGRYADGLIIGE